MSSHFYTKNEISNLAVLKRLKKSLYDSFADFDGKVFEAGVLPVKAKELIAVGCAHVTRCPYCIDAHVRRARAAGASDEEIAEAVFVATAMNAGASMAHACISMEVLSENK